MPELPEVEVVRRGLDSHVTGATFTRVEALHPRAVRGNDVDLADVLPGRTITGTGRRGKFLWLLLNDEGLERSYERPNESQDERPNEGQDERPNENRAGHGLLVHLRMSGQMLVGPIGGVTGLHVRIRAEMISSTGEPFELVFVDQRTFGSWQYVPLIAEEGQLVPATIGHIAPDPFESTFDPVATARAIRTKNSAIKTVLLNQGVVSGIGSIYADEALWAAGIKPTRKARTLRQRDAVLLLSESRDVMARALEQGGTSFDSLYVNVNGASGYFSRSLNAYGQAGKPCARCGTAIARTVVNGRSSYYCPVCQAGSVSQQRR
ncbi:bifunctional DNA-formamidopyrimidine glycosylase/DNA-(apurinic or apyrimidinic site) lyase [Corynebacterium aquatimens]|uniref:Formamidopyrimidine-DNA glycosylase n=1 Tax=Corynebacterium aquatimens TaxID=1190508 RepID=A0A931GSC2_9CORY|nr:bifunctional DNA-formamidopyrimidine glycosylase/DNA-(apurinic or apyrimidinic site) lyase [Corynebacterium aquatimens]MBG6121902.1 formamidopyrimidine-DNA glycosylase [Corynebacterium aquatimens]WJY65560.1 Formamidopyrimidine-DNA glycosylase 1 [Corynebacterium aquatimens]